MGRRIRRRWMEIMERFIRLNRSILDCDLAKGGWRLDEEAIATIEDADRLARALPSTVPYCEGPTEMDVARGCD